MDAKKMLIGILVLVFGLSLTVPAVLGITFSGIPDVTFDEDSADSNLDLDSYVGSAIGTVTYSYSGNTNIYVNIAADGIVTFTAKANWNGNENIAFTATDSAGSAPDTIQVTVRPVNDAPVLSLSNLKAYENVLFTYDVSSVTNDVDGDSLEYIYSGTWTTFVMDSSGRISFTPTSDDIGRHKVTVTVKDTKSATDIKTIDFLVTEASDDGSLVISDVAVDDETGDDDELLPGDWLQVEFDVENTLKGATAKDIEDIEVRAWVEDKTGDRVSDRIKSEKFNVDADDDKSLVLNMRMPLDLDEGDYVLVMKAQGEDQDGNTKTNLYFEDLKVQRNSHDLLIESTALNPTEAQPGGSLEFAVHLYNIGDTDEDDVKVRIKNSELGIDKVSEAFEVEKRGSDADVTKRVIVDIPALAKAGEYQFEVLATYNEGSDSRSTIAPVTVAGEAVEAAAGAATVTVGDSYASARPGETVKYTVVLTNTEPTTASYEVAVSGVGNWASASAEPATVTLASGAEMPVFVYLTPKEGTSGDYTATVTVKSGETTLATKTLTMNVLAAKTKIIDFGTGMGALAVSDVNTLAFAALVIVLIIVAIGLFAARRRARIEVYGKKGR